MTAADGSVLGTTQVFGLAPRNRAFNVVLLAEGFRHGEQAAFDGAVDQFRSTLLGAAPFDRLQSAINVFRVNVASRHSGADDPVATGGSGATPRTYFDATFGGAGIRRLLLVDDATALTVAAAQVPEFTLVLVVVNSDVYGGAGGTVGTFSLAAGAMEVALHEMGHSAFGLADEYDYWAGGNEPDRAHHPPVEPVEPNVTVNPDRATLKWRWAVAATTPLPTTTNAKCAEPDAQSNPLPAATVGAYAGAHYYHCGAYRPRFACRMRTLGDSFCPVCEAVIVARLSPLTSMRARTNTRVTSVARFPDHLDLFAVAADGRTMSAWWDVASGWSSWFPVSGGVASNGSPLSVVARHADHLDLFVVGTDDRVSSTWWHAGGAWAGWFPLPGVTARPGSTVSAVARHPEHLDLFTTGADGRVVTTWWDRATGWAQGWFPVGGGRASPGSPVAVVARHPDHLDLFCVGPDNRVRSTWWHAGQPWAAWFPIGDLVARPGSTVTVVVRNPEHLDLFTTAADGRVMTTWWDAATGWAGWVPIGAGRAAPGSAVTGIARTPDHLDLFVVGTDHRMYTSSWHAGGAWAPWSVVSGGVSRPGASIDVLARFPSHLDLFAPGGDERVWSTWWDASSGWSSWFPLV